MANPSKAFVAREFLASDVQSLLVPKREGSVTAVRLRMSIGVASLNVPYTFPNRL